MSSKSAKKEDRTVLTEIFNLVEDGNSEKDVSNDPQNLKVQKKFDEALGGIDFDNGEEIDFLANSSPDLLSESKEVENATRMDIESPVLDFDPTGSSTLDLSDKNSTQMTDSFSTPEKEAAGIEMDFTDNALDLSDSEIGNFDEVTKKTEVFSAKDLDFLDKSSPNLEVGAFTSPGFELGSTSGENITTSEAKENIEATINDIIRPKNLEGTAEFDINQLMDGSSEDVMSSQKNDETQGSYDIDFNNDNSRSGANIHKLNESFDDLLISQAVVTENSEKTLGEFNFEASKKDDMVPTDRTKVESSSANNHMHDEDYIRLQATIRQLREEREQILSNFKSLKSQVMELEQDNLTLKAVLDETKIEVNILRKRNINEIEDYKYRLGMSEEKRALAEEKVKHLEKIKEKFEQKARIDYNQIRQREKELESKLELMAMDVDSQVQGRDQKILELRRKIDSLEFNMENVTIREQKSVEDKLKLEDKLNKIMKTLRNSIKNLEDDIESTAEDMIRSDKQK